jgi:hypothetical protein
MGLHLVAHQVHGGVAIATKRGKRKSGGRFAMYRCIESTLESGMIAQARSAGVASGNNGRWVSRFVSSHSVTVTRSRKSSG